MNNRYFQFIATLLLLCPGFCFAQITIYSHEACKEGDYTNRKYINAALTEGESGENRQWDFSQATTGNVLTFSILSRDPSGTNNPATLIKRQGMDTTEYFRFADSTLSIVYPFQDFDYHFFNGLKYLSFPLHYTDSMTDSMVYVALHTGDDFGMTEYDSIRYTFTMALLTKVDGWGMIRLPGLYRPSLRIRQTDWFKLIFEGKKDSTGFQPIPALEQEETSVRYAWYSNNAQFKLAEFDPDANELQIYSQLNTGIIPVVDKHVPIVVNPLTDQLQVLNEDDQEWQATLTDINGRDCLFLTLRPHLTSFGNLEGLSQGIYMLRLQNVNGDYLQYKLIK